MIHNFMFFFNILLDMGTAFIKVLQPLNGFSDKSGIQYEKDFVIDFCTARLA